MNFLYWLSILVCLTSYSVTGATHETFIVNGADSGVIPFLCHLEISLSTQVPPEVRIGSGSLVTQNWVITVAQNVFNFDRWRIGMGATTIGDLLWFEGLSAVSYPDYNPENLLHNIAMIQTNVLLIAQLIAPIAMADDIFNLPPENLFGRVAGFGFDASNNLPQIVQGTNLTVTSQNECSRLYGSFIGVQNIGYVFCAHDNLNFSNICGGDQGGPFYTFNNFLIGISSTIYTSDCLNQHPALFVRISRYSSFIQNTILSFDGQ